MQQQLIEITHNQSFDQKTNNITDNRSELKRKLKRKLSDIYKRVAKSPEQTLTTIKKPMQQNIQLNSKVSRKDTIETKQTLTDINQCTNILPHNQQIEQLIIKSENDPFLKRKLKTILENDLKNLKKLNKKDSSQNVEEKISDDWKKTSNKLNSSQVIESQFKHIPKDISMVLNDSVILRRSDPCKKNYKQNKPQSERVFQDFTDQEQRVMVENQKSLNQQFTTLRKQNYKNKISSLQSLRSNEQKQIAITKMALERFVDKVKKDESFGKIRKNSGGQKKEKAQE